MRKTERVSGVSGSVIDTEASSSKYTCRFSGSGPTSVHEQTESVWMRTE